MDIQKIYTFKSQCTEAFCQASKKVCKMKLQVLGTMMYPFHAFLTGIFYVK